MSLVGQAGAYPSFCDMKGLGGFLLPPGWDACGFSNLAFTSQMDSLKVMTPLKHKSNFQFSLAYKHA